MKFTKDDIYGLVGSLVFHAVLFLILWFSVLKAAIPEEDGGVLVNFGNIDSSAGTFEPQYTGRQLPHPSASYAGSSGRSSERGSADAGSGRKRLVG